LSINKRRELEDILNIAIVCTYNYTTFLRCEDTSFLKKEILQSTTANNTFLSIECVGFRLLSHERIL